MHRRSLIAGIAATFGLSGPVFAHQKAPVTLPDDFLPTLVDIPPSIVAGQIHVFPNEFRLFLTLPNAQALRYTVGVGKPGLYHSGQFTVGAKQKWPRWRPTRAMIERNPKAYAQYADGMPGGEDNPLGARALYLFDREGQDTYLRIHGTNKPSTIGTAVSNGCARLTNDHIKDLYNRVLIGTQVFLYDQTAA